MPLLFIGLLFVGLGVPRAARATDGQWGGFNNNLWLDNTNWFINQPPDSSGTAIFNSSNPFIFRSTVVLTNSVTLSGMQIMGQPSPGNWEFFGGAFGIPVFGTVALSSPNSTLGTVKFSNFNVNAQRYTISSSMTLNLVSSICTNSLGESATLTGSGAMLVGTNSTFDGALSLAGTSNVSIQNTGQVKAEFLTMTGGTVGILSGGTLDLTGNGTLTGGWLSLSGGGTLKVASGKTLSASGSLSRLSLPAYTQPVGTTFRAESFGQIFATDYFDLANNGTGTLVINNAGSVNVGNGVSSESDWGIGTGTGTVIISNNGVADYNSGLQIADDSLANVNVTISSSGRLNVDNQLVLGGTGTGTITVNGGTLTSTGTSLFGANSTLKVQGGGSVSFGGDATFTNGASVAWSSGAIASTSGTTWTVSNARVNNSTGISQSLSSSTTLRVVNGGTFTNSSNFNISTGTLVVDGGSTFTAGDNTEWGRNSGNVASVTFSNGSGGTFSFLTLGNNGGRANVSLLTNGVLNITSALQTGNVAGTGSVTFSIPSGRLRNIGVATFLGGSTVSLSGTGVLDVQGDATFGAGSRLNWSGGSLPIASGKSLTFHGGGRGSFTNSAGGSLSSGATLRVTGGGSVSATAYFDMGFGGAGTLLVDGTGSQFRNTAAPGNFSILGSNAGGFATATFSGNGVGSFGGGLVIANAGGQALVNLTGGGQLAAANLNVGGGTGVATININGGTLLSNGTSLFAAGTQVNLSSGGRLELNGDGSFTTGSTFNYTGGSLAIAPGTILTFDNSVGSATVSTDLPNGASVLIRNNAHYDATARIGIFVPAAMLTVTDPGSRVTVSGFGQMSGFGTAVGSNATVNFANSGAGTFAGLHLGSLGAATFNVSTGASVTSVGSLAVGGASSAGVLLNVNGGSLNVIGIPTISLVGSASFGNNTNVNLSGTTGGFFLNGVGTFHAGSTLNWAGGTIGIANGSSLNFNGGIGSFTTSGGLTNGATLRIVGGGSVTAAGYFDIGDGVTGTLLVDESTSRITALGGAGASFFGNGITGFATVTFSNSGAGTYSGGLQMGGSGGKAMVTLTNSGALRTTTLFVGSSGGAGTINIDGFSTLQATSTQLNEGAVINFTGGNLVPGALTMTGNAAIIFVPGFSKSMSVTGLTMSGTSKIDMADNLMFVSYTGAAPMASIRDYLANGFHGGDWAGNGITSSAARAVALAGLPPKTALGYQNFSASGLIRIVYALAGDANNDLVVNALDFNALATNYGLTNQFWINGDFNYDGTINSADFTLLAGNFNQTLSLPAPPVLGALVPEPGTLLAGVVCLLLPCKRTSRRRINTPQVSRVSELS